ncbi:MAG: class I SAM-dependent methyltransferase, partial [Sedimentisphaerales bacterium]|nr:class I SAM-dependent methyltransferase [Sedimentisphaerales bacterium]
CSALWFCLTLQATGGTLITHEIDDYRASLARSNFKRAGIEHLVTLVEGDAHKTIKDIKGPIDILFLDADKSGNLDYLNKLLPLIRPGGLIIAHNTTDRAEEMKDYIEAITTNPSLETVFLHKNDQGIALTLKKRRTKEDKPLPAFPSKQANNTLQEAR